MTGFLILATVFLVAGVIAVPIAMRLGLGSVLGYLIAGIAISPVLSALHVDVISIQHFAEFGVVMMLFLVGLELEPKMLWDMRRRLIGLGGLQVSVTVIAVMLAAMALGQPWTIGLACGMVLALSSTAIVMQTLGEKGLTKSDGGQAGFSVLLFQDIAAIPMLAVIPLLALPELAHHAADAAHSTGSDHGTSFSLVEGRAGWQVAIITFAAIGGVIAAGAFLTGPLFRFIAAANLRELFVATALMFVIGIALLMTLVGLSPALGTFIAGIKFVAVFVIAMSALLYLLRIPIADLFKASGETRDLIYLFCGPLALASFFNGVIFVANASFNNLGHPLYSTMINWGRNTVGTWPFAIVGAHMAGASGVLVGQAFGGVVFAILAWWLAYRVMTRASVGAPEDHFVTEGRFHALFTRRGW